MTVDHRNRTIQVGDKVKIIQNVPSVNGMLYENQIVKIDEIKDNKIRVKCPLGKIYWVEENHVSASFL